jgi:hypothetical protein
LPFGYEEDRQQQGHYDVLALKAQDQDDGERHRNRHDRMQKRRSRASPEP